MQNAFRALLILTFATSVFAANKPKQYTIEQFMTSTSVNRASFSPDDSEILFDSNETGVINVYSIPVSGGKAKQLTNSKETTIAVSYFPRDRRVLYRRDN